MPYYGSKSLDSTQKESTTSGIKLSPLPSLDDDSLFDGISEPKQAAGVSGDTVTKPETKIKLPSQTMPSDKELQSYLTVESPDPKSVGMMKGNWDALKLSYKIADLGTVRGKLAYKQFTGTATKNDIKYLDQIESEIKGLVTQSQGDPYVANAVGTILPFMKESAIKGGVGALWGSVLGGSLALVAGQAGPQVATPEELVTVPAMAGLGAKIGATFSSLENMRQIETGSTFRDLTQIGIDPGIAYVAAGGYGMVSSALEAGALKLLTKMLPGSRHVVKDSINSAFKKAINKTVAGRIAAGIPAVAVGEATVETSQEFVNNVIEEASKHLNDALKGTTLSEDDKQTFRQALTKNLGDTFAKTMVGFGATAIPGVSLKQIVDSKLGIGDAKKDVLPTEADIELDTTWSEGQTKLKKSKKKQDVKSKPAQEIKPGPKDKPTPLPTVDDVIDEMTQPTPEKIEMTPTVFESDLSESEEKIDISITESDMPTQEDWKNFTSKFVTDEDMAKIVGKKMAEGANKIKLQPKDLRQPAVMLYDGTILKGPQVESWSISEPGTASKDIPKSWSMARETARNNGFKVDLSTEGFLAKGKFVDKKIASEKIKIYEKVKAVRQGIRKAATYYEDNPDANPTDVAKEIGVSRKISERGKAINKDLQTMTGELDIQNQEAFRKELQSLRKATQIDREAVSKIKKDKIIDKVVRSISNSNLGKHIDKSELTAVAQKSLWEYIRRTDPKKINEYVSGENKSHFRNASKLAMRYGLLNFIKEDIGQGVGMSRNQVLQALDKGTLLSPLSLDDALIASPAQADSTSNIIAKEMEKSAPKLEEGADAGKRGSVLDDFNSRGQIVDELVYRLNMSGKQKNALFRKRNPSNPDVAKKVWESDTQSLLDKLGMTETEFNNEYRERAPSPVKKIDVSEYQKQNTKPTIETKPVEQQKPKVAKPKPTPQEKLAKAAAKQKSPGARKPKTLEQRIKMREAMRKRMSSKWSDEAKEKFDRETEAMLEQATKPPKEVSKAMHKTLIDKLGEEKGSESVFSGSAARMLNRFFTGIIDKSKQAGAVTMKTLDVEWQWKRIGAAKTGLAMKNIFSRQDAEERLALRELQDFRKALFQGFGNLKNVTANDHANIVLSAELPTIMKRFSPEYKAKIKPAVDWINNYFVKQQQRLKDRGINVDYKQRMLEEIDIEIKNMTSGAETKVVDSDKLWDRRTKLLDIRQDISNMQFVHIPLKMWFDTQIKKTKKQLYASDIGGYKKAKAKLELLTTKKRHASLINHMLEKDIIDKSDINPIEIIMNYARRIGHDLAIADIRDAAYEEGLIKVLKSKPTATKKVDEWIKIPQQVSALQMPTEKGKQAYISLRAMNFINEALVAKFTGNWFTKALAIIKMAQFYNPLILPMYDVVQSVMATIQYLPRYPKAAWKTMNDIVNKTDDYYGFLRAGLASKPFSMPFQEWVRITDLETKRALGKNIVHSWLGAYVQEIKNSPIKTILKTPYIASWSLAWTLDEYVRMFTANILKDAGLSITDAAQTAAKFHGDYASVPYKTRKVLNYTFFTPTFKIAMGKLYYNMVAGTIKNIITANKFNDKSLQHSIYAHGLLSLMAIDIAFETLLVSILGFEPDEWFRRYKKKIWTDEGPKELVITLSNPANLPFKIYHKLVSPMVDMAVKENKPLVATSLLYAFQYELHPFHQAMIRFFNNKTRDGEPIVSEFDDVDTRAKKFGMFAIDEFALAWARMTEYLSGGESIGKNRKQAIEAINRDYNTFTNMFFDWLTFSYTRNIEEIRTNKNLQRLKREFKMQMKEYYKQNRNPNKEWTENYESMMLEIINELKKKK